MTAPAAAATPTAVDPAVAEAAEQVRDQLRRRIRYAIHSRRFDLADEIARDAADGFVAAMEGDR